jgi:type II secretory pathway pseudopilin PulG
MAGFTIIELLIAISVMLLLVGGGMAAFVTFNDKQVILGEARRLQGMLRSAQTKARNGAKPATCTRLDGYRVFLDVGSQTVREYAVCAGVNVISSSYNLPTGIGVESQLNVVFLVLHGGVVNPSTVTVTSTSGKEYTFEITQGGEITIGELAEAQ